MVNSIMLVGRLAQDIEVKTLDSGKEVTNISLAVPRAYKNADGIYETDFFDCRKGDTVGVRGRLQTSNYETEDGEKKKATQIIVEKLTFLSSKHHDMSEDKSNDDDMDM